MFHTNRSRVRVCATALSLLLALASGCAAPGTPVTVSKPQPAPRAAEDLERYVRDQYAIVDADLGGNVDLASAHLVFIGDSITRGWTNSWNGGGELWDNTFADPGSRMYSLNLGVSGDRPEHLLYRLLEKGKGGMGHLDDPAIDPETIFLMIGTNSLWRDDLDWGSTGSATAYVAQSIVTVANRLHELRPRAHIVVQSVLPVKDSAMNRLRVEPINTLVKHSVDSSGLERAFSFLDLYPHFLDATGNQDRALFRDGVHLNADGYAEWRRLLFDILGAPGPGASFTYPGGLRKALVISMDDGNETDREMVDLLNRFALVGTFHLNSGFFGQPVTWFNDKYGAKIDYVEAAEIVALYDGHEISSHSFDHTNFWKLGRDEVTFQVLADKSRLEEITGAPVAGISYPFGAAGEFGPEVARSAGYRYGRLAQPTRRTDPPLDPFRWAPTARPDTALEDFLSYVDSDADALSLFLFMGHSYEYTIPGSALDWRAFEEFCRVAAQAQDIWNVTMIDYTDYLNALQLAQTSLRNGRGRNDSDIVIWISTPDGPASIAPGRHFEFAPPLHNMSAPKTPRIARMEDRPPGK